MPEVREGAVPIVVERQVEGAEARDEGGVMDRPSEGEVRRIFAMAATLLAERVVLLESDRDSAESLEDWVEDIRGMLEPLGDRGACICQAIIHLAEGQPGVTAYRTTAAINRKLGPIVVMKGPGVADGEEFRPGIKGMSTTPLLMLLQPWADPEDLEGDD
jgi:hypothetical protein